jgi:hypothetical protein
MNPSFVRSLRAQSMRLFSKLSIATKRQNWAMRRRTVSETLDQESGAIPMRAVLGSISRKSEVDDPADWVRLAFSLSWARCEWHATARLYDRSPPL